MFGALVSPKLRAAQFSFETGVLQNLLYQFDYLNLIHIDRSHTNTVMFFVTFLHLFDLFLAPC